MKTIKTFILGIFLVITFISCGENPIIQKKENKMGNDKVITLYIQQKVTIDIVNFTSSGVRYINNESTGKMSLMLQVMRYNDSGELEVEYEVEASKIVEGTTIGY